MRVPLQRRDEMHPNHQFLLRFVQQRASAGDERFLDFGCGGGEVVEAARSLGLDMYGADTFYEGSNARQVVEERGLLGGAIRETTEHGMDFPDAHFDGIVSNQVFEHVFDMEGALDEIVRVLKPSGFLLALFPDRGVWREGHCGVPFLHRFRRGSRARLIYATAARALGTGYFTEGKSRVQWARDFCDWIDAYTCYRPRREVKRMIRERFECVRYIERELIAFRLQRHGIARALSPLLSVPVAAQAGTELFRRLAHLVILAERPAS